MEFKAEDLLKLILTSCFYVNDRGELEWMFNEGHSIESTANVSSKCLEPYISKEQLADKAFKKQL
jgi:hypothetical protein